MDELRQAVGPGEGLAIETLDEFTEMRAGLCTADYRLCGSTADYVTCGTGADYMIASPSA